MTELAKSGYSMKTKLQSYLFMVCLGVGIPVWAHHSFSAVFDVNSPIELIGAVTEIDWRNPHAWIYIDVENGSEKAVNWAVELGSVNGLIRRGWSRSTVRIGDVISVSGYRAKDGSTRGNVSSIKLADGREMSGSISRD